MRSRRRAGSRSISRNLGVDVLTLSAHKIGGPQGAGAIVLGDEGLGFAPLLTGGGQERRHRAGTENVAAIAGFGAAARGGCGRLGRAGAAGTGWRDRLAAAIARSGPESHGIRRRAARLPQTLCVAMDGVSAETLVIALDLEGVAVSSGSACSSGKVAPSHVLAAMGVPENVAKMRDSHQFRVGIRGIDLDLFSNAWRRVLKHVAPGAHQGGLSRLTCSTRGP